MESLIVNSFNNNLNIEDFKSSWIKRIAGTADLLGITIKDSQNKNSKLLWKTVMTKIHDKNNISSESKSYDTNSSTTRSNNKTIKLSCEDKESIKNMFTNLDINKMWVLSTGTIVEKKMEQFATICNFEHPCHSLVFDPDDLTWNDYFSSEELQEIRCFNRVELKELPSAMKKFGSELQDLKSIEEIHKCCFGKYFHPVDDYDIYWMQLTIINCSRFFFKNDTINFNDATERDITYLFDFMTTIFLNTDINANFGEISCKSASVSKNKKRKLAGVEKKRRSSTGHMVDVLFKSKDGNELGCIEVGLNNSENSTKELDDGKFKILKSLKEMFLRLGTLSPRKLKEIKTIGFSIMGNKVNMLCLDNPSGYVCRVIYTESLYFPTKERQFIRMLMPLMTLCWNGKEIMEETLATISDDNSYIPITFTNESTDTYNHISIPNCFWPTPSTSSPASSSTSSST
ncbi:unnamed protein product [Cunninghamella blakesleeana]